MRRPYARFLAMAALSLPLTTAAPLGGHGLRDASPGVTFARLTDSAPAATAPPILPLPGGRSPSEQKAHSFYFTRAMYSGWGGGWGGGGFGGGSWSVDYPVADRWIVSVLGRLTGVDVFPLENPVRLDDPDLRRFPFLYALEVGGMNLRKEEVEGLRDYLLAGGFLVIDDFWGESEWYTFEREIRRILPEYEIVDIGLDHPIFSTFYEIDEIIQVPNVGQGIAGGPTHENGETGRIPRVRGIFDEQGRLMVIINWNTDLGDAWEWAEDPAYPLQYSTYAYQMAANFIVYAMSR
ncbi:MAG: DUF4159 domain-containing protein [Gemmatimonas sp.]|nr:DUF4159 domain-containing protein [Gemmatimonas sp.]